MSRDELIALVGEQRKQIAALTAMNEKLAAKRARLEHLLSRNSANSSMPASKDDDPGKTPPARKTERRDSGRKRGKQPGAPRAPRAACHASGRCHGVRSSSLAASCPDRRPWTRASTSSRCYARADAPTAPASPRVSHSSRSGRRSASSAHRQARSARHATSPPAQPPGDHNSILPRISRDTPKPQQPHLQQQSHPCGRRPRQLQIKRLNVYRRRLGYSAIGHLGPLPVVDVIHLDFPRVSGWAREM